MARPALQGQAQAHVGRGVRAAGVVVVVPLHGRAAELEEGTAQGPRGRCRRPRSRDPPCEWRDLAPAPCTLPSCP